MHRIDGKRVSRDWHTVLTVYGPERFQLNSGQRTLSEQKALYDCWRSGRCVAIAAFPNPNAPHIRIGRQAHALDVQCGVQHDALVRWLERQGLTVTHTVKGECWHIEVPEWQLRALAAKLRAHQARLVGYRSRYARVKAAIIRRQQAGVASPGQRKLLARIRKAIDTLDRRYR